MTQYRVIMEVTHLCLTTTYFTYKWQYYQQNDRAATISPFSPIVANTFREHYEVLVLESANKVPSMWIR